MRIPELWTKYGLDIARSVEYGDPQEFDKAVRTHWIIVNFLESLCDGEKEKYQYPSSSFLKWKYYDILQDAEKQLGYCAC